RLAFLHRCRRLAVEVFADAVDHDAGEIRLLFQQLRARQRLGIRGQRQQQNHDRAPACAGHDESPGKINVRRSDYTAGGERMHVSDLLDGDESKLAVADFEMSWLAEIGASATYPIGDPVDQALGRHAWRTE